MKILAIDPGTTQTGYVLMEGVQIIEKGILDNFKMKEHISFLRTNPRTILAYEMIACYGMAVGRSVFETCIWIGRFKEVFGGSRSKPVFRREVKMHLCGSVRAKDANVRQAIIDMYPPTGGGRTPQIGIKSNPGPLFGVSSHIWPALGVSLTYQKIKSNQENTNAINEIF